MLFAFMFISNIIWTLYAIPGCSFFQQCKSYVPLMFKVNVTVREGRVRYDCVKLDYTSPFFRQIICPKCPVYKDGVARKNSFPYINAKVILKGQRCSVP